MGEPLKDYRERGLSDVLRCAEEMVGRAAKLLSDCAATVPIAVSNAKKREANLCLAEAEELIARVRAAGSAKAPPHD